jgi:SAM-dependent methyltransferase
VSGLVLTGERTLPGIPDERYWFVRHEVAYHRVAALLDAEAAPDDVADPSAISARPGARGKRDGPATADAPEDRDVPAAANAPEDRDVPAAANAPEDRDGPVVLDAGCGEGYGLAVFAAAGATRVIGADLDPASAAHATARYADADTRIEVVCCELSALPLDDGEVDLTVSLQVIEHVWDVPGYLASLRRVTRAGGLLAIATPNRLTFTPDSEVPVNPFHVTEFAPTELVAALERAGLEVVTVDGLHHTGALADFEAGHRVSLPRHLGEVAAQDWTPEVRARVHATTHQDFRWADDELDVSLDLLAVCRVRP